MASTSESVKAFVHLWTTSIAEVCACACAEALGAEAQPCRTNTLPRSRTAETRRSSFFMDLSSRPLDRWGDFRLPAEAWQIEAGTRASRGWLRQLAEDAVHLVAGERPQRLELHVALRRQRQPERGHGSL